MKNNQTIKKNSMMKKLKIHNLSMLVIAASLSACSLSKPGDKERSSMLNGDGDFQSVSIKKKTPGSSTKTGDSGNNAADKEAMASASFSSGESVALGSFVSKVAKECGESPAVHKIAHISGDLALNLNAVRTLLDEKQKDTKESDKVNFEVLTEAIFGEDLGKEIVAGKSEPIVQWVNYCQKTADDPKIYGWITDNTLIAEKIAYAPKMKPVLSEPQALSLAWAKQNLANMLAGINPIAHADDTVDLSSIKVPVYPLIDSSIDNDQVTAYYQKTAAANFLPESLQYSFGLYASAVGEKINANSPEEEKIIFNAEQRIIPTGQKAQLKGTNEVKFSTDSKGASDIYMKVHVLDDNGEPDKQNFFTWIQGHLDGMAGLTAKQRAVLVNTGNGKVIVPSPDDINAMAERAPQTDSEATSEQGENHNNTSTTSSADDSGDTSNPGTSTDSNTTTLQTQPTKETFYSLPSWVHGQGNNTSQVGTPSDQPVLVSKEKATLNSTLNPFEGTDFECPSGYNLVSLKIACADCLGPDMEGFGWSKEQLKANNETLESQENYKMLDDIFGPNTAQTLLASKDGAQHTINICFNDEEYMGYFDDA
ncbi:hypothetical protein MRY82_01570, partial [bacterium]|nr:hypothetical protein [bacterium]